MSYKKKPYPNDRAHITHIKRFIEFQKKQPRESRLILNTEFLVAEKNNSRIAGFHSPSSFILDSPFVETGLASINFLKKKYSLWQGYLILGADFVEFVKSIGVQSELTIIKTQVEDNPNWTYLSQDYGYGVRRSSNEISNDWSISGLISLLKNPTIEASRLIWKALISAKKNVALAQFRLNTN